MPSLSSMPAFSTEGVVDSCRVSIVRLARTGGAKPALRGSTPADEARHTIFCAEKPLVSESANTALQLATTLLRGRSRRRRGRQPQRQRWLQLLPRRWKLRLPQRQR